MLDLAELGLLGLFLASFLAATVLPLSSEAVLVALLVADVDTVHCLIVATAGNSLGGFTSYGLGYLGKWRWIERWFGVKESKIKGLQKWCEHYGVVAALLSWLPVVGDPLAIALGFFRVSFWKVAILMALGKLARYYAIIFVGDLLIN